MRAWHGNTAAAYCMTIVSLNVSMPMLLYDLPADSLHVLRDGSA